MVWGLLLVAGCGLDLATSEDARSVFFDRVGSLCEQEWAGVTELAPASDEIFRPSPLTLHLEECGESELRFRFGVDGDLTRSWLLRLEENGSLLFLQGRGDPALGMKAGESWGGWATSDGTTLFQHFPDYRTSHAQNPGRGPRIWRLQIDTVTHGLIYHLDQGDKARFRLVFEPVSETGP